MRKVMNLSENTTLNDLEWYAEALRHPIAVKLRKNLELWIEESWTEDNVHSRIEILDSFDEKEQEWTAEGVHR